MLAITLALVVPVPQCPLLERQAAPTAWNSWLGSSIAVHGDLAVAGTNRFASGGLGGATIYERIAGEWSAGTELSVSPSGGIYARPVALHGTTLMVADMSVDLNAGAVHVFEHTAQGFVQTQVLVPATTQPESHFGRRMALDGDRLAVAAPMDPTFELRGGAVFLFERQGGVWVETQRIDPPTTHSYGFFGLSLALHGDLLAIGEPGGTSFSTATSEVRLYRRGASGWQLEATLPPAAPRYGTALALQGERLAIGSQQGYTGTNAQGVVDIYERLGGTWILTQRLVNPGNTNASFGSTLVMSGELLGVGGSHVESGSGNGAWLYARLGATYEQVADFTGPSAYSSFGAALAFGPGELWIGAPAEQVPPGPFVQPTGVVRVYSSAPLARPYCAPGLVNSTGRPGELTAPPCVTLTSNDLVLRAEGLPAQAPTVFFIGNAATAAPLHVAGLRCVGGELGRTAPTSSDGAGIALQGVDLTALPLSTGARPALAGETWRFQCWYRDAGVFGGSRLTNAVALDVRLGL